MDNISNDIKVKVLAKYLGHQAITTKATYKNPQPGILQQVDIQDDEHQILIQPKEGGYYLCSVNECKLILKDLTLLSDEDATRIAKLIGGNPFYLIACFRGEEEFKKGPNKNMIDLFIGQSIVAEYLRINGYDLPQLLLAGKTLREAELAVYSEKETAELDKTEDMGIIY